MAGGSESVPFFLKIFEKFYFREEIYIYFSKVCSLLLFCCFSADTLDLMPLSPIESARLFTKFTQRRVTVDGALLLLA